MRGVPTFGKHHVTPTLADLFALSSPEPNTGCWLWLGTIKGGYGNVAFCGRTMRTHRLAYELTHGPIPSGLCVCHRCDTPSCCNPDHLFLGTPNDNNQDKIRKGRDVIPWLSDDTSDRTRVGATRSMCQRKLHAMTGWNVIRRCDGNVQCRECKYARDRARRGFRNTLEQQRRKESVLPFGGAE